MPRPHAASYECGSKLVASGCPLDYLEDLPRKPSAARKRFYVRELTGYTESRIFDFGIRGTGYVIALEVGTVRPSGIIISDWGFIPPWEQHINWDYDPSDVIPKQHHDAYERLFDSHLSTVLNDQHLLTRGHPVSGLLCGSAFQPIPDSIDRDTPVHGKLSVRSETGCTVTLRIRLPIHRIVMRNASTPKRRGRLFDKPDFIGRESVYDAASSRQSAECGAEGSERALKNGSRRSGVVATT